MFSEISNENLNSYCKIMRNDNFEIDNSIKKSMLCIICKRILINGYSGPCGGRYCMECIKEYLNESDKYCPGESDDCKKILLNIDTNIHIDQAMNRKISKVIVKCPDIVCAHKCELRHIEEHIRLCNAKSINCPYLNLGCVQPTSMNDDMKKHLLMDIYPHSNMLIEWIENLRNEIESLRRDVAQLRHDNEDVRCDGERKSVK